MLNSRQQSLDWTGLDSSGLDWKRSSATLTPNSIGLGWKMSSKNKYNFVALSLQLHEVYMEQPPTVVGVTSKYPGRLDWKRSSATQTRTIFSSFRTSQKVAVFAQEKWLHSLSMGDTHSEVTIMPLEDFSQLLLKQEWLSTLLYSLSSITN